MRFDVDVWDEDLLTADDWMCATSISLRDLAPDVKAYAASTVKGKSVTSGTPCGNPKSGPHLFVRLVSLDFALASPLTLFIMRHGRSEWNEAKAHHDLVTQACRKNGAATRLSLTLSCAACMTRAGRLFSMLVAAILFLP